MYIRLENKIKLTVKEFNEKTNEAEVVGSLNSIEVSYLVQFAINYLMAAGVEMDMKKMGEVEDQEALRFELPDGATLQ